MSRPRPTTIAIRGGTLDLRVHDAYFTATYKALRRVMIDCHPDRRRFTKLGILGGNNTRIVRVQRVVRRDSTTAFLKAQQQLAAWLATEVAWYAAHGLDVPLKHPGPTGARGKLLLGTGRADASPRPPSLPSRHRRVVRRITYQGVTRSIPQWAQALGITDAALYLRLKRRWPMAKAFDGTVSYREARQLNDAGRMR